MNRFSTCLWFDTEAAEAADFYVSVFPNSRIINTMRYPENGPRLAGMVLTVQFMLDGSEFLALNAGPQYKFTPAMSIITYCDTQQELDTVWERLTAGGQEVQCGWLTDKYGVSWQVVPRTFDKLLNSPDRAASQRAFSAMMKMVKLDIGALQRAYDNA
jgi:predicted 3-demethylubiquinone-9 3-methyltransferase (glyoxalase superfamily)